MKRKTYLIILFLWTGITWFNSISFAGTSGTATDNTQPAPSNTGQTAPNQPGTPPKETPPHLLEPLIPLITEKKWDELPSLFLDNSHLILKETFASCRAIALKQNAEGHWTYFAKLAHEGEMGSIFFEKKEGKYLNLSVRNPVKPFYYIDTFKKYKIKRLDLPVGDAQISLQNGYLYQAHPWDSFFLFRGTLNIKLKPNDEEEKLTLKRKFKQDYFSTTSETAVFLLDDLTPLKSLTSETEVTVPGDSLQPLLTMYGDLYGMETVNEWGYWFLPFPEETNLFIFEQDPKQGTFYYYSFNSNLVPDTQLTTLEENELLLSYNAVKQMKLFFGGSNSVKEMKLNMFFNPRSRFISGTARIYYHTPAYSRQLALDDGIGIAGNLDTASKGLNAFKKRDKYYLVGPESSELALFFKGNVTPSPESLELFIPRNGPAGAMAELDQSAFYFLSQGRNFYPNPGDEFFKSELTINLPGGINCLASGSLTGKNTEDKENTSFQFNSPGTKGIALVTGNFQLAKTVDSKIPLHFHAFTSFDYLKELDFTEIKNAMNLFTESFGTLDVSGVNILMRVGEQEGGISNTGFIVLNYPPYFSRNTVAGVAARQPVLSPILTRSQFEDYILHELSHQWWGGIISWNSYQDVWITEGLAHFSVLYYLKKTQPERKFERIISRLKRWVYRYENAGPIMYGTRIAHMEPEYEAYQSIVYNKTALVLLALMELTGEEDFFKRLHTVVEKYKYTSISTGQFIRQFSEGNDQISGFLKKWIYSRRLPMVRLDLLENHQEFDKKEFKTIALSVTQLDTEFIFPYVLKVTTAKGVTYESHVMNGKEQPIVIKRDAAISNIDFISHFAPVREKKTPPPPKATPAN